MKIFNVNRRILRTVLVLCALSVLLLAGCDERRDTRQYIKTIGAVFTLETNNTFQELYVFPGDISDMGQDFLKNSRERTKVGSFGVTVEASDSYTVWLKDWDGGTYVFSEVPLTNGALGVITFAETLSLDLRHLDGSTEVIKGQAVKEGDAPSHPQAVLEEEKSFRFEVENQTGQPLHFISMREEADPEKGEVELFLNEITAGASATISGTLSGRDLDISEWLLCAGSDSQHSLRSETAFNPWTVSRMVVRLGASGLTLDAAS